jgi:hypothetical protein
MAWFLIAVAMVVALILGATAAIAALVALLAVLWIVLTYGASEAYILLAVVTVLVALESEYPFTMSMILLGLAGSYAILRDVSGGHLEPRQSPTVGAPPRRPKHLAQRIAGPAEVRLAAASRPGVAADKARIEVL